MTDSSDQKPHEERRAEAEYNAREYIRKGLEARLAEGVTIETLRNGDAHRGANGAKADAWWTIEGDPKELQEALRQAYGDKEKGNEIWERIWNDSVDRLARGQS